MTVSASTSAQPVDRDAVVAAYANLAARRDVGNLAGPALRLRSRAIRDVFAHLATEGSYSYDDILEQLRRGGLPSPMLDASRGRWTAALGRLVAAQGLENNDRWVARQLFDALVAASGPDQLDAGHQTVYAQLLYLEGSYERCAELLPSLGALPALVADYLHYDLANPFVRGAGFSMDDWLERASRPFTESGLEAFHLRDCQEAIPFDRLSAVAERPEPSGPLVSVIMPVFQPDESFLTSVRSILSQSWVSIEVIVVDDASGPRFEPLFQACADLDGDRITIIRQDVNGGAYLARNAGLDHARGDYVTFQDSDDWSHPRRIEQQVEPMLENPDVVATRSLAVRARPDLSHQWLGYPAQRVNASSLMFRRRLVLDKIGYFDSIRKGADAEYAFRLEVAFGRRIHDVRQPLAYTRLRSSSLSRGDFALGWAAPARIAHQAAYRHWHRAIAKGEPSYMAKQLARRPFPVPKAFTDGLLNAPETNHHFDVVLVDDWQPGRGPHDALLDEVAALTDHGMRVGLMQLEAPAVMTAARKHLGRQVQEIINAGVVDRVLPDDQVSTSLVLVRDPIVLQFPPAESPQLNAARLLVTVPRLVTEYPCVGFGYDIETCHANAKVIFRTEPVWAAAHENLLEGSGGSLVLPSPVTPDRWTEHGIRRPRARSPIVGLYDDETVTANSPVSRLLQRGTPGSRTMAGRLKRRADLLTRQVRRAAARPMWDVRTRQNRSWADYLSEVDFFACFPRDGSFFPVAEVAVHAMASGAVVIAPERFSELFGEAAVYCTLEDLRATAQRYHGSATLFRRQADRGRSFVERWHDPTEYVKKVRSALPD